MTDLLQFVFILAVPLAVVAGALASLFGAAALLDALEHSDELSRRIDGAFRRPPRPSQPPPADHYYKPYWSPR